MISGRQVAGVKIDVEGFEEVVLAGAAETLRGGLVDAFQLEWNGCSLEALGKDRTGVASILIESGYRLARPDEGGQLHSYGLEVGADVFAVRQV